MFNLNRFDNCPVREKILSLMATIFTVIENHPSNLPRATEFLINFSFIPRDCLCYPVLEGFLKFLMNSIVDQDGIVLSQFSVEGKNWNPGDRISNIATLLKFLEANAATIGFNQELSEDLADFRGQIEIMGLPKRRSTDNGWDSVFYLRNASMHGAKQLQFRAALITHLICLLILHKMTDQEISAELALRGTKLNSIFYLRNVIKDICPL